MSDAAEIPPPEEPKMEVHHKPKPVHGWREFLAELFVVVLGVGIALGAEQAVEWLHWQHRVADARAAILLELRDDDGPQAYTRAAAVNCFDQQLDGIRAAIETKRSRAEIASLIARYAPPIRTWDSTAWDLMLASDVASHVAPDQMSNWGGVYVLMPRLNSRAEKESSALAALRPIHQGEDMLSASETDTMLAAVAQLRASNTGFNGGSIYMLWAMEKIGISVTPERKSFILDGLRSLYGECVVMPSTAGGAPTDQLITMRRAMARAPQP